MPSTRAPGEVLVRQGERQVQLAFVRQGLVAQRCVGADGGELSVALRGPRTLLGLEALRDQHAQAEVVALSPVRICALSPEAVRNWLGPEGPSRTLVMLLLEELERLRDEGGWRRGSCISRVARFALAQANVRAPGAVSLPKATVARMLQMRAETFSRCLRELVEDGVLAPEPPHAVLDESALVQLAADDSAGASEHAG